MKTLVLAEKPSVARDLAHVLGCHNQQKNFIEGQKYIVTWALGHLVELKMPEDYDKKYQTWRLNDLPLIPDKMGLKVIRKTSAQFKAIERLAKRSDINELVIATDAGREGELVARWIIEKIHWKKPVKRLWISSQTDRAIRDGFKQLKPAKQYDSLYQSAVCRAEADWLIGLNVTRALTTKYDDPLSAGRVQTPTLAMVLERENAINSFVPKEYWTLHARFPTFTATWERKGDKRLFDEARAQKLHEKIQGQRGTVRSIRRKGKSEPQLLPYDLTELQRDANQRFGFSAKKTLNVLQGLYEHHKLVTYPRTDSRYLTNDLEKTMRDRLRAIAGAYKEETQPLLRGKATVQAKRVFNEQKVTDHHAIIPTDESVRLSDLSPDERRLYDLIARRFLTLFYPPHRYDVIHADIDIAGETFTVHDTVVRDPGFKAVLGKDTNDAKDATYSGDGLNTPGAGAQPARGGLATLREGSTVVPRDIAIEQAYTEPPQRLTEADLLARMEKHGLGTPATRADIIERLIATEVVERQNGRFAPTRKGKQLIDLVNDELKSPELTARWERELEAIARGKGNARSFLADIRTQTKKYVRAIKQSEKTYRAYNLTGSKCPECGEFLKEVRGKDGKVLVCSDRACGYRRRKDPILSKRRCPQCRKRMEIHQGKAGKYFQCRPCGIVEKLDRGKKAVSKREERQLLKKYSEGDSSGSSLADAFKAALQKKDN
ncbi:DNA topoisomerase III [Numidum massiliense]|uniref:DNA topoisomerase III n=1 Tax=Numidum massiliense TaxID=1522315 RepID=UPI0006D5353C|nr:DNA topoisomerase III [Numidum massiliense]